MIRRASTPIAALELLGLRSVVRRRSALRSTLIRAASLTLSRRRRTSAKRAEAERAEIGSHTRLDVYLNEAARFTGTGRQSKKLTS